MISLQTGILRTVDEDFVIEPHSEMTSETANTTSQQAHIMYKRSTVAQNTPYFYDSQTCTYFCHVCVDFKISISTLDPNIIKLTPIPPPFRM